ncbi:MAG: hypothetical protein ABI717_08685, partial [Actinomycetota bacterium]
GVTVLTTAGGGKPTLVGPNVYRYYFTGNFAAVGPVTATFAPNMWSDSAGNANILSSASFTIVAPSSSVSGPFTGNEIDVNVANGSRDGAPVTAPSASESADAGTLSGTYRYAVSFVAASESALGVSTSPITVSSHKIALSSIPIGPAGTTARKVYRKLGTGTFELVTTISDNTTMTFLDNAAAGGAAPAGSSPLYVDVTYNATPGATLNYASIFDAGDELNITGGGATGITFSGTPTGIAFVQDPETGALVATVMAKLPRNANHRDDDGDGQVDEANETSALESDAQFYARLSAEGVKTFRYVATSNAAVWGTGTVNISFVAFTVGGAGWQDSRGEVVRTTVDDRVITVQGPTGQLADPLGGSGIDVNVINGRNYMDVMLPAPTDAGWTIDANSVTDLAPEFRLSGDALGSVTIDSSQAPVLVSGTTYRYWINGLFAVPVGAAPGAGVTTTFIAGSVSYKPGSGTPGTTSSDVEDPLYLEVTFPTAPAGYTIDPASIIDGQHEFTLSNATSATRTIELDDSEEPRAIEGDPYTFRFRIKGTYQRPVDTPTVIPGDTITVTFIDGTWSFTKNGEVDSAAVEQFNLQLSNNRPYIDVVFRPVNGASSVTLNSNEISLGSGGGRGTAALAAGTPLSLGNGRYRYYLTGSFVTGLVAVTFRAGGFTSGAYANLESTKSFTSLGPTADLVAPGDGAVVSAGTLNNRGYIDVLFNAGTKTIDASTITDADAEFMFQSGSFTGTLAIDTTQAPVFVSGTTYRYWTKGTLTSGTPIIDFIPGSYGFTDLTSVGTVAPATLTNAATTVVVHYIDVRLTPTAGNTINAASVNGDEISFGGAAAVGATLTGTAPTHLPDTPIYRYYYTGAFSPGLLEVTFGSFSSGGFNTVAETEELTIQQLTGDVADPTSGGAVGADVLNERGYVDVTFLVPTYASTIDAASITDADPEFTISGAAITLDAGRAPVLISHAAGSDTYLYRYFYTGPRSGSITVNFIGGTVQYLDSSGAAIPLFQQQELVAFANPGGSGFVVDIAFGATASLDVASIEDLDGSLPEITATGGYVLARSSGTNGTYRYTVTHSTLTVAAGTRV